MKLKKKLCTLLLAGLAAYAPAQQKYAENWASLDTRPIPQWYEDAKFGIFIHWGLYSVPSWAPNTGEVYSRYAEWYWQRLNPNDKDGAAFRDYHNKTYGPGFKYQDFVKDFKAEMFNPASWADMIQKSGAKYVVLTSKHHEGFALWPSAESVNWNSVDVGPHRDICGELSDAVRKKGMHMGFYFSLYEWHHPYYKEDVNKYVDYHMLPQLKDLTTRYRPDIVWADGEWEHPSSVWKSENYLAWLFNDSPVRETVVVNDRWGKETRNRHGSFFTTEYDLIHDSDSKDVKFTRPWEECRGISGSFGYNRNENLEDYSSATELIHILIEKVSRGGNLLLNVGPTADGRIPVIMQERLSEIGEWLKVNGEAIYGTRQYEAAGAKEQDVFYTRKGNDLYLIVTKWTDKDIRVKGIRNAGKVTLLGWDGKVTSKNTGGNLVITPPKLSITNTPCRHAWVYKIENVLKPR